MSYSSLTAFCCPALQWPQLVQVPKNTTGAVICCRVNSAEKGKRLLFLAPVRHLATDGEAASVGLHRDADPCGVASRVVKVRLIAECNESSRYLRFQRPSHRLKGPASRSFVAAATLRLDVIDFSRNSK